MRIRRSWIAGGALLLLGGAAVAWLLRPERVEVEWVTARSGAFRVTLEADAFTRARSRYQITAPVSGRLERLALQAGDRVVRGGIVARIAPVPLDAAAREHSYARLNAAEAIVRAARSAHAQANRDLARARLVEAAGGLAPQQLESVALVAENRAADLRAAEAELAAASAAVRATQPGAVGVSVPSPVTGHVLRVPDVSERVTAAGTPILELADAANLEIVADLLSTDAVRVAPGMSVELDGWGGDGMLQAKVRLIEPVATTRISALGVDEQRVNVILDFVTPCDFLGDGYRVTARFVLWEGTRVLSIPSSAVFREGDQWRLYVIERERARARTVAIGRRSETAVEVRSGIVAGESVILFPSDRVQDGTRIRLRR